TECELLGRVRCGILSVARQRERVLGRQSRGGARLEREQTAHDQLFKDLLRAFFREFVELFFPDVAQRLEFTRAVPRDKELFTDVPRGKQRELDLVTEVPTREGKPEVVLIHVEVESGRRPMGARMHEYYMLLRLRLRLPVLPVVIYL